MVLFVHPAIQRYREGLLQAIHDRLGAQLVFVGYEEHNRRNISPAAFPRHHVLPAGSFGPYRQGVSLELVHMALRADYRVWIASNISSFPTHSAAFLVRARRRRFVLFGEDWWWPAGTEGFAAAAVGRAVLRCADAVIAAGSRAATFYVANGADPASLRVAINACPPPPAVPQALGQELRRRWRGDASFVYLFLNRLVEVKGLHVLLKAFRHVAATRPDSVLLVVGDGPERAGCETLARDLGLHNVRFLGAVSPLNVRPYYELADVYVHPAVTVARGRIRGDAWGFTINEAMAVGCPVVASTAVGAVDDLIRDGVTGRVVPAGDESALAQALLEMQAMPIERRAAMAESARAHLEAVASVDRQAAVFVEVVNTLTQSACVG